MTLHNRCPKAIEVLALLKCTDRDYRLVLRVFCDFKILFARGKSYISDKNILSAESVSFHKIQQTPFLAPLEALDISKRRMVCERLRICIHHMLQKLPGGGGT